MYQLLFNQNLFIKNLKLIEEINKNSLLLFAGEWLNNSAWKGLKYLEDDYNNLDSLVHSDELLFSFFKQTVSILNTDYLNNLNDNLIKVSDILIKNSVITPDISVKVPGGYNLSEILVDFDLESNFVKEINFQFSELNFENKKKVVEILKSLLNFYLLVKSEIMQLGSLFCYYQPKSFYLKIEDLLLEIENNKVADWPSLFRHLGQKFYDSGEGVKQWSALVVGENEFNQEMRSNFTSYLFGLTIFYLSLSEFPNLQFEIQKTFFTKFLWNSLLFNAPFENILKKYLANLYSLDFYIVVSGNFANELEKSDYPVYWDDYNKLSIGILLQKLNSINDNVNYNKTDFVKKLITDNQWPIDLENVIHKFFYVYNGLRNCNFVDYRGFLSAQGLVEPQINWKNVISEEIDENVIKKIKEYFDLNPIPFIIRMEMLDDFMDFSWSEEPYLSRILLLSDLYEEYFGPIYPALLYFDENLNTWKLNACRPPNERIK